MLNGNFVMSKILDLQLLLRKYTIKFLFYWNKYKWKPSVRYVNSYSKLMLDIKIVPVRNLFTFADSIGKALALL
jgi:hypothetical protein